MYELERLTAQELTRLLEEDVSIVVVPFGSVEHHGGHLPLGTDALLADAMGRDIATHLGAVLAPTQRIGDAGQHMDRPGTLTLGTTTLTDVAVSIVQSLAAQGFRLIVLLSTHGGNFRPLRRAVEHLNSALPENVIVRTPQGDVGPDPGSHSGEWITSVMLALHPDLVDIERADETLATELRSAGAQRGREHLERFAASIIRDLDSLNADPPVDQNPPAPG
jgi:creatinine amidohydrolase/Fe(II)-dependent formamide hydrolase-like protein